MKISLENFKKKRIKKLLLLSFICISFIAVVAITSIITQAHLRKGSANLPNIFRVQVHELFLDEALDYYVGFGYVCETKNSERNFVSECNHVEECLYPHILIISNPDNEVVKITITVDDNTNLRPSSLEFQNFVVMSSIGLSIEDEPVLSNWLSEQIKSQNSGFFRINGMRYTISFYQGSVWVVIGEKVGN